MKFRQGIWRMPKKIDRDSFTFSAELKFDTETNKGIVTVTTSGLKSFYCGLKKTEVKIKASDKREALKTMKDILQEEIEEAECEPITLLEIQEIEEELENTKMEVGNV